MKFDWFLYQIIKINCFSQLKFCFNLQCYPLVGYMLENHRCGPFSASGSGQSVKKYSHKLPLVKSRFKKIFVTCLCQITLGGGVTLSFLSLSFWCLSKEATCFREKRTQKKTKRTKRTKSPTNWGKISTKGTFFEFIPK